MKFLKRFFPLMFPFLLVTSTANASFFLPDGAVTTAKIKDANVTRAKLAAGARSKALRVVASTDQTVNTTLTDVLEMTCTVACTITLPTAVGIEGYELTILHNGTQFVPITIHTASSQTVGGIADNVYKLNTIGESLRIYSDNANWKIASHHTNTGETAAGAILVSATSAYVFTVTAANATVGAIYSNNSQTFIVTTTIAGTTTLTCSGSGTPAASGTLTKVSGTGDSTITFSSKTVTGVPSFGTPTLNQVYWHRVGRFVFLRLLHTIGSGQVGGTGDYVFTLTPSGIVADVTNITFYTTVVGNGAQWKPNNLIGGVGTVSGNTDSGSSYCSWYNDGSHFRCFVMGSASFGALSSANNFGLGTTNTTWNYNLYFPVKDWQP